MKKFGHIKLSKNGIWEITPEPHVMIKLKAIFRRIDKTRHGTVFIQNTDEVCRDLEWFMQRYPLDVSSIDEIMIRNASKRYQKTLEELEQITLPNFIPREFDLEIPLRDYQARAVEMYLRSKALLVADQVGLGKTATAIGSLTDKNTLPALVVCQTHLVWQWKREIERFLPFLNVYIVKKGTVYDLPEAGVYIITYHKLHGWADLWCKSKFFKSIIFDEVQELRHSGSGKYKAAEAIRKNADYCIAASATPIYNYGGEIWNVMNIVNPGKLGTKTEFNREWCQEYSGDKALLKDPKAFGTYLRDEHLMVRRTREEVHMELPPVQRVVQAVPYNPKILDNIKTVATELAKLILNGTFHESGQAAREFDIKLRQSTGIAKAPYVAEFVKMLLEEDEQVLLFGWHREVYTIWMDMLKGYNPVMYTGSETAQQKDRAKQEFISKRSKVMMMSLRSGVGVDGLQTVCRTNVFGELDYSPGVHEQAEGRTFRPGSINQVTSFFLVADAGSDPPIAEILGLKKSQVQGLLLDKGDDSSLNQVEMDRVKRMAKSYLSVKETNQ